jgi:hypothetical protein
LKRNFAGCAICDSTWGNVWEEVEGERMFFCCRLCATQFRTLIERIERETGWTTVEAVEISGDRRGRECVARSGSGSIRVVFSFTPEGELLRFVSHAVA